MFCQRMTSLLFCTAISNDKSHAAGHQNLVGLVPPRSHIINTVAAWRVLKTAGRPPSGLDTSSLGKLPLASPAYSGKRQPGARFLLTFTILLKYH
jgi:hypothetical protein